MTVDSTDIILICDRAGIIAFAFAGAQVGIRRSLDIFGVIVLGIVTATGGGVIRDLLLDQTPLVLIQEEFLPLAVAAALISVALTATRVPLLGSVRLGAESVGLGAFAAAGAFAGINQGLSLPAVIVLGVITACGGGVIRDLLAARVPLLLRSEINATAAAAGAIVAWSLESHSVGYAGLAALGTTAAVKLAGRAFDIHLPIPGPIDQDALGD